MAVYMGVIVYFILCLQCAFSLSKENELQKAYVTYSFQSKKFSIVDYEVKEWVAKAEFQNSVNKTCWAYLDVTTSSSYNSSSQAYAAGLVEGYITRDLITLSWQNTVAGYCSQPYNDYCSRLHKFLEANYDWVLQQIKLNPSDPYWHNVQLFYGQLAGLSDGYHGSGQGRIHYDIDVFGMYMMQIGGDLEDLESALHKPQKSKVLGSGSCSALIKLLPDFSDLYVSQDTWSGFNSMLRILKRYDFPYQITDISSEIVPGQSLTFSSYPGALTSGDDYYLLSSGMVSMETTIGNSNSDLWKFVQPTNSVLEGVRSMVANRLAKSGQEWAWLFSRYNSGTYNNAWMVVDYSRFTPGQSSLAPGLFTLLEQIPGQIKYADLTEVLQNSTYFASYNVAYFPEIFNASGGNEMVKKYGEWFSYDKTARANIFRRDHKKVKDVDSMMKLMRYNDYTKDPLSRCNCTPPYSAENAISARCDLNPDSGTYPIPALSHRAHGGIDMKLTTYKMFQSMDMVAIGGPTYDNLPPFQWSKSDFASQFSHLGHPDIFMFKPVRFNGTVPAVDYP